MKIYVFLFLLIAVQALPVEKVNDSEKPLETADIVNNQPTEEDKTKDDVDVSTAAVDEKETTPENVDEEKSTKTKDEKSSKPYDWCPERSECKKGDLPCILCYGNEAFNVYPCRGFKQLEIVEV